MEEGPEVEECWEGAVVQDGIDDVMSSGRRKGGSSIVREVVGGSLMAAVRLFFCKKQKEEEEPDLTSHKAISPPTTGVLYPQEEVPQYVNKSCVSSAYADIHPDINIGVGHLEKYCLDNVRPITTSAVSPRIEITPSHELYQSLGREFIIGPVLNPANTSPRSTLPVPGYESTVYREPACLSPASSNSSASWHSETNYSPWTSPCVSPNNGPTDDLCPQFRNIHTQNSPRTSPGTSPRTSITEDSCLDPRSPSPRPGSRSASPVGKRTYEEYSSPNKILDQHRSRSPSPQAFREDTNTGLFSHQAPYTTSLTDAMNGLSTNSSCNIPTKIVKTNAAYSVFPLDIQTDSYFSSCEQDVKRKQVAEQVLLVPPNWTKQLVPGLPFYSVPVASLPPLEWPLSSHLDNYSLQIDVQPKPHHRAHYETEGSRGAVKAPTGGHPIVQKQARHLRLDFSGSYLTPLDRSDENVLDVRSQVAKQHEIHRSFSKRTVNPLIVWT
ncbi:NFAC2 factor, partial [Polypterus senegalus]